MSDEELRDELMTLLLAGHETTATSLAWAIERLVRHPAAIDRLVTEAQEGGTEYAEAVCKETLRMRPCPADRRAAAQARRRDRRPAAPRRRDRRPEHLPRPAP